jgi:hypothetical protein
MIIIKHVILVCTCSTILWMGPKPHWCGSQVTFGDLKFQHLACVYLYSAFMFFVILCALCSSLDSCVL